MDMFSKELSYSRTAIITVHSAFAIMVTKKYIILEILILIFSKIHLLTYSSISVMIILLKASDYHFLDGYQELDYSDW